MQNMSNLKLSVATQSLCRFGKTECKDSHLCYFPSKRYSCSCELGSHTASWLNEIFLFHMTGINFSEFRCTRSMFGIEKLAAFAMGSIICIKALFTGWNMKSVIGAALQPPLPVLEHGRNGKSYIPLYLWISLKYVLRCIALTTW